MFSFKWDVFIKIFPHVAILNEDHEREARKNERAGAWGRNTMKYCLQEMKKKLQHEHRSCFYFFSVSLLIHYNKLTEDHLLELWGAFKKE